MLYEAESGNIQMAITGDSLITRSMAMFREERFLKLVELLRGADVAFTNAEMLFHNYEAPPSPLPGGTYMRADPRVIKELQWLGIGVVGCANNHSYDYGEQGVLANIRYLDQAGLPHAGTGRNLAEARAPAYVDTPRGRVALISATTSGTQWMLAADQWRDGLGRPGANLIRYTTEYTVDRPAFDALRRMSEKMGFETLKKRMHARHEGETIPNDTETRLFLPALQDQYQYPIPSGATFVLGESFASRTVPNLADIEGNLQRIRDARRQADWVIVTLHNHEQGATADEPPDVAIHFARAAIDAGADVFAGHGPHRDRGIEIYKGKPIFYSLGHLILQNDTVALMPRENMGRAGLGWEATPADWFDHRSGRELEGEWLGMSAEPYRWRNAVAMVTFEARKLKEVRLHPIDLGFKRPRAQRGRPLLAQGEVAQEVLKLFQRLSNPFGTNVQVEDGVGVVRAG
ncbi:MAG: CapA family protein [Chloroflexi bacterium]|nr:CapA family protein [Chloroflexota bacterium]